jgi:predicted phage terminase large subunit-like protein
MKTNQYDVILFKQALRDDLESFTKQVFATLHPGEKLLDNWHIGVICEYLTTCYRGDTRRLNINIPPRFLKSIICSVAFPMWVLGNDPRQKFICCSFSASLSNELNDKCRTIANSAWYKDTFPLFSIENIDYGQKTKDTQKEFITTMGGGRYATSTRGTATGKGATYIIADDIINPDEASSDTKRTNAINWVNETLFSRLNNQKTGVIINVAQRLHENDFSAQCIDQGWQSLVIPVYFDKNTTYKHNNFFKEIKEGDYLHKDRIGEEEVRMLQTSMGSTIFAGQYLQIPAPAEGSIFKKSWFRFYDTLPEFDRIVQSWDTAFKKGEDNDYSVCTTWGIKTTKFGDQYYLIDVLRVKLDYPSLKIKFIEWQNKYNPYQVLVEDKASGQSLIQDLRKAGNHKLRPIKVDSDKITRANACTGIIESGGVFLPSNTNWLDAFFAEISVFPNGSHDDQVDSVTQFLNWANAPRPKIQSFSF